MMDTLIRRLIQRQHKLKRETLPQNEREMMRDLCATIVAHTLHMKNRARITNRQRSAKKLAQSSE